MSKEIRNKGFHHVVYACKNGEETRHFYEDLLGMPLVHTEVKNRSEKTSTKKLRYVKHSLIELLRRKPKMEAGAVGKKFYFRCSTSKAEQKFISIFFIFFWKYEIYFLK